MKCFLFVIIIVLSVQVELYSQIDQPVQSESKPEKRERYFYEQRAYPYKTIPDGALANALEVQHQFYSSKKNGAQILAQQPKWRLVGPAQVGGRVRSIVHHPTNDDIVYIGAANGGVWKTIDGGGNWRPIMDFEKSISMGALAIDNQNPEILYAATGEFQSGHYGYVGAGIFKSIDAGTTWKLTGLSNVGGFSKIYVHPQNSDLIFAGGVYANSGFYKSSDGGASWKRTLNSGYITDITINPKDQNNILIAVNGVGIFRSIDGGETWGTKVKLPYASVRRISIQMSQSDPNYVYALVDKSGDGAVIRSKDNGITWEILFSDASIFSYQGNGGQGGYDNFIAVHPTNPKIVIIGGVNLFRSDDEGANWTQVGGYNTNTHPDMHCCSFNPNNPDIVYVGCDGGMNRSDNAGEKWSVINNGLAITQFHGNFALDQSRPKVMYGGTQDNGSISNSSIKWGEFLGGDGGSVAIDSKNSNIIYAETQEAGNLTKIDLKNGSTSKISDGIPANDKGIWAAPLVVDPSTNLLFSGRRALYASVNQGSTWSKISPTFDSRITTIVASQANSDIIYVGTESGEVYVTASGGRSSTDWIAIDGNGLPNRYVTDIEPSFNDENTCYITFSGYNTDHIYKTSDLGKTWKNISKNLPNAPTNCMTLHPDDEKIIFVGTDVGAYCTYTGGESWIPLGTDFPTTSIMDMQFYTGNPVVPNTIILRVSTHGRSMWEVDVPNEVITPVGVEEASNLEFTKALSASIYPNPASDIAYISYMLNQRSQFLKIEVTNLLGTTIRTLLNNVVNAKDLNGIVELETSSLASGVYTVFFTINGSERIAHRIVITH